MVGAVADIAGYLKPDYAMKGVSFSIKDEALNGVVAGSLRSDKRKVYLYNFYSLDASVPQSDIINNYKELENSISDFTESRNKLNYYSESIADKLLKLQENLKNIKDEGLSDPEDQENTRRIIQEINEETAWRDRAGIAILDSDTLQTEYTTFVNAVNSSGGSGSGSKLLQALFREKVNKWGITHLLFLKVISSGGESIKKERFWPFSSYITFIGGAVVTYVLSDMNGNVLASDNISHVSASKYCLSNGTTKRMDDILSDISNN